MGGDKAGVGSGISETGKCILELFRKRLCPEFVRDEDLILLTSPWEEADYRVGIYLYDIQDHSVMTTAEIPVSDTLRRFPPKAVELSYLVFCNETHRFGGVQREQIQTVLSEIVRTVYDNPEIERKEGESVFLSFLRENVEFKIRLWGSFNRPLQPAVYLKAAPVLIESGRLRSAGRVQEREYQVEKKEE